MEDNMIDVTPTDKKIEKIRSQSEDIKKDYEYTRGNLYSIIEKGQELSMAYLNLLKKVKCLEHMRLLVN